MHAPGKIDHILKAVCLQEIRDLHAASAMMTDAYDFLMWIKFPEASGYAAHWHQHGTIEFADVKLPWLTHIE